MVDIDIRPPVLLWVLTLLPVGVFAVVFLSFLRQAFSGGLGVLGIVLPVVLGLTIVTTLLRLTARVRAYGDGRLEIRDRWYRTTVLQRSDVDRLLVDRAQGRRGGGWRVELLRPDGRVVPLDATERPWRGSQGPVLDQRDQLAAWVEGRPVMPRW